MNLEGKYCKPANIKEYKLMKAVALAAGYKVLDAHVGYLSRKAVGINTSGEFLITSSGDGTTINDWVFKATHKDTGELVVPEWANHVLVGDKIYWAVDNLQNVNNVKRLNGNFITDVIP